MIPDMLLIYMHYVLKHYYNYYAKQVHFQWKMTHYILNRSKSEQVFSDLLPQFWQQSWSYSIGINVNIIIICCYLNVIVRRYFCKVVFSIPSSRYLCTCMFVMLQQLFSDICSISNSQFIIGIWLVLSFIIPLLNYNGILSFTMEDFLVIFSSQNRGLFAQLM